MKQLFTVILQLDVCTGTHKTKPSSPKIERQNWTKDYQMEPGETNPLCLAVTYVQRFTEYQDCTVFVEERQDGSTIFYKPVTVALNSLLYRSLPGHGFRQVEAI